MKPILFNTDMVHALLANRKTVTRRVVKLKYSNTHLEMFTNKYGTRLIEKQNEQPGVTTIRNPDGTTTHTLLACIEKEPPYRPGDILYVRETWRVWRAHRYEADAHIEFKAGGEGVILRFPHGCTDSVNRDEYDRFTQKWGVRGKWRPSIHMPREAARIFLRVTNVRVKWLRDISDAQIVAEGIYQGVYPEKGTKKWRNYQRIDYANLWNSTLKPADRALYGWESNPYVWVIEFERISREEAEHGEAGIGQA